MVNNESDSESECFESAEESLEEEEDKVERKTRFKENLRESESGMAEPAVLQNNSENETVFVEDFSVNLSYRKRPERIKRTPSTITQKVSSKSKKSNETVFKADAADVFFQDITSNLSKNINKSLHSLQQTSSNVKDLILSALPSPSSCEGFVYDEGFNIVDDKVSSNETIDEKTDFTVDNLNESPNFELVQNAETGSLDIPDIQSNNSKMFVLEKECLERNSEDSLINKSFPPISDSETRQVQNSENNKIFGSKMSDAVIIGKHDSKLETVINKKENLKILEKSDSENQIPRASELNNENNFEGQINEVNLGHFAINISSQNNLGINISESEGQKETEDEESSFPSETVPPCTAAEIHSNIDVIDSLQTQNSGDQSFIDKEFYLDSSNNEENLDVDCKNTTLKNKKQLYEGANTEFDKKEETVDKNSDLHYNRKVGCNKTQEEESSNYIKINSAELKTDNEIIIQQTEVNDKIKTLQDGGLEIDFNMKESSGNSNEINNGWDDFDFSDNEIEGFNVENVNKDAKLNESKDTGDVKVTKHILTEASDPVEKKSNMNFTAQKTSSAVSAKKYVEENAIDGKCKEKETSKKEGFDDDWEWESWDDEADEKGESICKTTDKNYDKAENIADDGSKWSGWDNFSQRMEEKQGNWNIGTWGVNLLLNKATAVTQGISNVLEASLGAPDPETLARMQKEERQLIQEMEKLKTDEEPEEIQKKNSLPGVNLFPVSGITNLVAGVTSKIVEHTKIQEIGSKVLTGGLDTLETFGKKTMEVLQDGDPGLRNKRALLTGNNKPVLSQILREAREKADKEINQAEEKALAKKCHFETLFDDYQGMVHLEALEMLSRQYELKLEQVKSGMSSEELEDLEGVLEEVEQLCALDDLDINSVLDFKTALQMAVEPLKEEISIEKIIQAHESANKWLQTASELDPSLALLHQKAVSIVAELTAAIVHEFLKAGELLSIKECRKTVDEIDALAKLTTILCMEINKVCEKFILMARNKSKKELLSTDICEKITIMRNNSTSYIKQAFNLLIPVLQAGAAL